MTPIRAYLGPRLPVAVPPFRSDWCDSWILTLSS
jgi:hypothetical protein